MLAHDTLDLRNRSAHISAKNTATATTQARILPERFHGPDEPYECKKASTRIDAF